MAERYQEKPKNETERPQGEALENPATRIIAALALIGLGVFFLLNQMNILNLSGNWWAIFIAIPAVAMLYNAYTAYNRDGRITAEVRKNLSGGVIVATVAFIAATNQWGKLWPLFLIVPGVLLLLGLTREKD